MDCRLRHHVSPNGPSRRYSHLSGETPTTHTRVGRLLQLRVTLYVVGDARFPAQTAAPARHSPGGRQRPRLPIPLPPESRPLAYRAAFALAGCEARTFVWHVAGRHGREPVVGSPLAEPGSPLGADAGAQNCLPDPG